MLTGGVGFFSSGLSKADFGTPVGLTNVKKAQSSDADIQIAEGALSKLAKSLSEPILHEKGRKDYTKFCDKLQTLPTIQDGTTLRDSEAINTRYNTLIKDNNYVQVEDGTEISLDPELADLLIKSLSVSRSSGSDYLEGSLFFNELYGGKNLFAKIKGRKHHEPASILTHLFRRVPSADEDILQIISDLLSALDTGELSTDSNVDSRIKGRCNQKFESEKLRQQISKDELDDCRNICQRNVQKNGPKVKKFKALLKKLDSIIEKRKAENGDGDVPLPTGAVPELGGDGDGDALGAGLGVGDGDGVGDADGVGDGLPDESKVSPRLARDAIVGIAEKQARQDIAMAYFEEELGKHINEMQQGFDDRADSFENGISCKVSGDNFVFVLPTSKEGECIRHLNAFSDIVDRRDKEGFCVFTISQDNFTDQQCEILSNFCAAYQSAIPVYQRKQARDMELMNSAIGKFQQSKEMRQASADRFVRSLKDGVNESLDKAVSGEVKRMLSDLKLTVQNDTGKVKDNDEIKDNIQSAIDSMESSAKLGIDFLNKVHVVIRDIQHGLYNDPNLFSDPPDLTDLIRCCLDKSKDVPQDNYKTNGMQVDNDNNIVGFKGKPIEENAFSHFFVNALAFSLYQDSKKTTLSSAGEGPLKLEQLKNKILTPRESPSRDKELPVTARIAANRTSNAFVTDIINEATSFIEIGTPLKVSPPKVQFDSLTKDTLDYGVKKAAQKAAQEAAQEAKITDEVFTGLSFSEGSLEALFDGIKRLSKDVDSKVEEANRLATNFVGTQFSGDEKVPESLINILKFQILGQKPQGDVVKINNAVNAKVAQGKTRMAAAEDVLNEKVRHFSEVSSIEYTSTDEDDEIERDKRDALFNCEAAISVFLEIGLKELTGPEEVKGPTKLGEVGAVEKSIREAGITEGKKEELRDNPAGITGEYEINNVSNQSCDLKYTHNGLETISHFDMPKVSDLAQSSSSVLKDNIKITVHEGDIHYTMVSNTLGNAAVISPSQLNLAEHINDVVSSPQLLQSDIKGDSLHGSVFDDRTAGPAIQLAGHPAAASFILDHSRTTAEGRDDGLDASRELVNDLNNIRSGFEVVNGYLRVPRGVTLTDELTTAIEGAFAKSSLRIPTITDVPVVGKRTGEKYEKVEEESTSSVDIMYLSAVPVGVYNNDSSEFTKLIAKKTLEEAYYGAFLKAASLATGDEKKPVLINLLGGGAFKNEIGDIMDAVKNAIMRIGNLADKLDFHIQTYSGKPTEFEDVGKSLKGWGSGEEGPKYNAENKQKVFLFKSEDAEGVKKPVEAPKEGRKKVSLGISNTTDGKQLASFWMQKDTVDESGISSQNYNYSLFDQAIKKLDPDQLYDFMTVCKIRSDGGWFYKDDSPSQLHRDFVEKIGQDPIQFCVDKKLKGAEHKWINTKAKQQERKKLILSLIHDPHISNYQLSGFFIKTASLEFLGKTFDGVGVPLETILTNSRPSFFAEKPTLSKVSPTPAPIPKNVLQDPLAFAITLNGHGSFSTKFFEVPQGVIIAAPCKSGFDKPYIFSAESDKPIEETLYGNSSGIYPKSENASELPAGWRFYTAGEMCPNVEFSSWKGNKEYNAWCGYPGNKDIDKVKLTKGKPPPFALLPARDKKGKEINYQGENKQKVKIFKRTNLGEVCNKIKGSESKPVILMPFTCNATGPDDPVITAAEPKKGEGLTDKIKESESVKKAAEPEKGSGLKAGSKKSKVKSAGSVQKTSEGLKSAPPNVIRLQPGGAKQQEYGLDNGFYTEETIRKNSDHAVFMFGANNGHTVNRCGTDSDGGQAQTIFGSGKKNVLPVVSVRRELSEDGVSYYHNEIKRIATEFVKRGGTIVSPEDVSGDTTIGTNIAQGQAGAGVGTTFAQTLARSLEGVSRYHNADSKNAMKYFHTEMDALEQVMSARISSA